MNRILSLGFVGMAVTLLGIAPTVAPTVSPYGPTQEIEDFARAWGAVTSYSATVTVFEQKDARVQNVVFSYGFRKPLSATVHVTAGSNAGANLIWAGGDTVVVSRGSGFAAFFKKKMSLQDPQVTTIRGSSIDQLSFGRILEHAQNTKGVIAAGAGEMSDGVATAVITLAPSDPTLDAGLTREDIELSTKTHLPVRVRGYDGLTLVRKIDFSNVKLTP